MEMAVRERAMRLFIEQAMVRFPSKNVFLLSVLLNLQMALQQSQLDCWCIRQLAHGTNIRSTRIVLER